MSDFKPVNQTIIPMSADPGEEFPFLRTITVVDRVVSVDKAELVQNNIKTETVTLNLDSEWEGLSTVINLGNEKPVSVIWSGEPVVIPAELMTTVGSLDVSVVGYGDDGGIRAVTKQAQSIFNVVASGYVEGDEAVPDPTTILGQLIQAADNANQAADRFNQASEDIEGIGPAIEKVQASEANAKQSETNAASSAQSASQSASAASASAEAAGTSETNAAASATEASEASTEAKASETNAASSATAASQSASQAQSSATAAASSAQAASTSAESAKTASDSATSSKDAAAQSASDASASASAAKASETNAASSASAAKASETNAAASATAAQQAVDGFGLEVGTTTTGDPGTDAAVEIQKAGTKYTASFTIPRGDKGEQGDVPSLSRTMASPESQRWAAIDFNDFTEDGVYTFNGTPTNSPRHDSNWITGTLIVTHSYQNIMQLCAYSPSTYDAGFAFRRGDYRNPSDIKWKTWHQIAFLDGLPSTSALANEMGDIASLSTRVQALEARVKSLETNQ